MSSLSKVDLIRKYLAEANENINVPEDKSESDDTIASLADQIKNGQMTPEDLTNMVDNGELAEEDYHAVISALDEADIDELLTGLQNGQVTIDDIEQLHSDGSISDNAYNTIKKQYQDAPQQDTQNPSEIPEELSPEEEIPQEEPQPIVGKFNLVRLFDKFTELKQYMDVYIKAYKYIETDHLTDMQVQSLSKFYEEVLDTKEKLTFYMENSFGMEDYKKNLYSYLLFNNDFANQIRKFRTVLRLNPNKLLDEKNNKTAK